MHTPDHGVIIQEQEKKQNGDRARWLTPVIPTLWEAQGTPNPGGSPEVRSSRPA